MSLSTLNSPPLVALSGLAATALPSLLQKAILDGTISWTALQLAQLGSYGLNYYATLQPGRLDGKYATDLQKNNGKTDKASAHLSTRRGQSLVSPSGWAFAIWAPIFLGELVYSIAVTTVPATAPLRASLQHMAGGFISGQVFQTLWCASFRPKYYDEQQPWKMYVSSAMLAGIAYSMSVAHQGVLQANLSPLQSMVFGLPITLHFGWTTAATLVNWNGNLVTDLPKWASALAGHLSVVGATVLGVGVTWTRTAPLYGATIAWALTACATELSARLKLPVKDPQQLGLYGARLQRVLCGLGAVLTAGTSVWVAATNLKLTQ